MSTDIDKVLRTFPKSVQPGIPKLKKPKQGWRTVKFGDVLAPVARPVSMDDEEPYRLVTVKRSRGGIEERSRLKGKEISVKSQFELSGGDFLISKRQIVHGACAVVPDAFTGAIVSNEYSVLICTPELDLNFLGYLAHSIYFQQTCFHSSIGVHVEKMIFKLTDWFEWPINLPTLPEQQKIAAFLGAVDSKLAALRRKQAGLERFKAGLMQRLFSQKLRFTQDDGSAFPDWEEKRLGDILTIRYGKDHKGLSDGDIPVYGTGGIMRKVDRALYHGPSILIGRKGTINKPMLVDGSFWTVDTLFYTEINAAFIPRLVFALVERVNWLELNEATGVPSLNSNGISSVKVCVPAHPDEQRKIADALSALDMKITATAAQITKIERFKQGLLQQMFV